MRLLKSDRQGELSLTRDFAEGEIPPYAILSHRWLAPIEEPTFEDLTCGQGKEKPGYKKLLFCFAQAKSDGLGYFWVDTCCINKADKAELARSINSMFRWYQDAAVCHVYLGDVPNKPFQESIWFTRGWTLQELLAPRSVIFYNADGERLGDKNSRSQEIHEITSIPRSALCATSLHRFTEDDRFSWMTTRETALEEDKVYSLLGIFDVYIAPLYGEGFTSALQRLRQMLKKRERCVRDLYVTNPHHDKSRIEEMKGGILVDCCRWILDNPKFVQWRGSEQSQMLWIRGDPGKGKTMLLCSIIDELQASKSSIDCMAHFFCQAGDPRINNATSVLRGLISLLIEQRPSLTSHLLEKHNRQGKAVFDDSNAWLALSEMFRDIVRDPGLKTLYLVVDALDECVMDREKLLELMNESTAVSSCVKWLVSSRNWRDIEQYLGSEVGNMALSLGLNEKAISTAVQVFIRHKVDVLTVLKKYDTDMQSTVHQHLASNAQNTFLWVALVCQQLSTTQRRNTLVRLREFPPGLDALYHRMWEYTCVSDDAGLCQRVLALIATVYRPITVEEVTSMIPSLTRFCEDLEEVREVIASCGSFLSIREDTIEFVHQSAKDFLLQDVHGELFPNGMKEMHQSIFTVSLQNLFDALKRDIYELRAPDYAIENVQPPNPDPLARVRYSCVHWIDHLDALYNDASTRQINHDNDNMTEIHDFIQGKYLYWLEALSLCHSLSEGVLRMSKLRALIQAIANPSELLDLVQDAVRFIMYHKHAIQDYPLQTYISALLFSPRRSLIRHCFQEEEPKGIAIKPAVEDQWNMCLQTLEGHSSGVNSVVFSHDSSRLASASWDDTIKIWDATSGKCVQTLEGHSDEVTSVVFSHDSTRLASASRDMTVKIWDASSGRYIQTLEGHSSIVSSVVFSHDSTCVASASYDMTVKMWDTSCGKCVQTLEGHSDEVSLMVFSHDSSRLASASRDMTVKIWDATSGKCVQTLECHSYEVRLIVFSYDSSRIASASYDRKVKIWDASSGKCVQTLEGHSDQVSSMVFSHDSTRVASASWDMTVKIWGASSGKCLQTLSVGKTLYHLSFSADGSYLNTKDGSLALELPSLNITFTSDVKQVRRHQTVGLSAGKWITHNSKNVVWLPSERRPGQSTIEQSAIAAETVCIAAETVCIGTGSGRVWMCSFVNADEAMSSS